MLIVSPVFADGFELVRLSREREVTVDSIGNKPVKLTLLRTFDSRCPIGAQCQWEGTFEADLLIEYDEKSTIGRVCMGACDRVSPLVVPDAGNKIELIEALSGAEIRVAVYRVFPY